MAQIFKESSNVMAKLSLMLGAMLPLVGFYFGSTISRSPANTKAGVGLKQPAPFSHKHHVFELGIDCRYCHVSVEKSPVASVPTTETCMSCHSQIWTNSPLLQPVRDSYEKGEPLVWNKVNKLPEFVYFDHSIHIARGVSCNQCHGAVQQMMMTSKAQAFSMDWCLTCHSEPEKFLMTSEGMLQKPHEPEEMKPLERSKWVTTLTKGPRQTQEAFDKAVDEEFAAAVEEQKKEHEKAMAAYREELAAYQADIQLTPKQQVFELYHWYQAGRELTPRGYDAIKGKPQSPGAKDIEEGKLVIEKYKIAKKQLRDCYICHR